MLSLGLPAGPETILKPTRFFSKATRVLVTAIAGSPHPTTSSSACVSACRSGVDAEAYSDDLRERVIEASGPCHSELSPRTLLRRHRCPAGLYRAAGIAAYAAARGLRGPRARPDRGHRLDQRAEIAVAREQHHVVDVAGKFHGVDGELDIHVAFDLAAAGLVDELFGRFSHNRVAVVVEPVDQRPDRGKFLILDDGGVIQRPQQIAARLKLAQKPLVIDVKAERLRGGMDIGTANEQREFFFVWGHEFFLVIET
jgi:hypothetical protein